MVADHWFRHIKKVLEAMDITSDAAKIKLAAFQLEGESQVWWDWVKTSRDLENDLGRVPWALYEQVFFGQGPRVPRAEVENNDSDGVRG